MKEKKVNQKAKRQSFPEDLKRQVIEEYLRTGGSKEQVQLRYGIKGNSAIQKWMKLLGYIDMDQKGIKLEPVNPIPLVKQPASKPASILELEAKIKLLERQLEDERLRSEFYDKMIDLAEKTYKIPVRKNSGTK